MPNDLHLVTFPIARLALAYLLHSTLLLGGTWLFVRASRLRSWALEERLWKLAVILPLITAAIPLPAAWSRPLARLNFGRVVLPQQTLEPATAPIAVTRHPVIAFESSPADQTDLPVMDDAARTARRSVASSEERLLQATPMRTILANEGGANVRDGANSRHCVPLRPRGCWHLLHGRRLSRRRRTACDPAVDRLSAFSLRLSVRRGRLDLRRARPTCCAERTWAVESGCSFRPPIGRRPRSVCFAGRSSFRRS